MHFEVLDVLALVFAIWLNVRKLDARKLQAADYPHVPEAQFLRWQTMATSAYGLGSLACFLKLGLDWALKLGGPRIGLPWGFVRVAGASLFVAWVGTLVWVWIRSARAGRLRDELRIGPPPRQVPDRPEPPDPDPD